ncbi:MAG: hypothetical protein KDD02_19070 [Phaeodactylibacter sp.]|nr:hypothetical protein [Phaeodactylibacter sp.]MCB9301666.1 hypothetical protein [Lewinellaceae bacterium]
MKQITDPQVALTGPREIVKERGLLGGEAPVSSGLAKEYWLELVQYPEDSARSLWLNVDDQWRCFHSPNAQIQNAVQNAFNNPKQFDVLVWYQDIKIVGLVVHSKG